MYLREMIVVRIVQAPERAISISPAEKPVRPSIEVRMSARSPNSRMLAGDRRSRHARRRRAILLIGQSQRALFRHRSNPASTMVGTLCQTRLALQGLWQAARAPR